MTILVTGGAGFIGSNYVLSHIKKKKESIINIDKLTYAGNLENLSSLEKNPQHIFVQGDITKPKILHELFKKYKPNSIVNFAAESHVDRSIHEPEEFIKTNVLGTFQLLECSRLYWNELEGSQQKNFRFLHISTDEVYGSLKKEDLAFTEENCYKPNSPYSASKASSDHLLRAYHHTYNLPTLTTNCSNNYGPYQFPEKLIPLIIHNALAQKDLPIYGDGKQIRDWLYVQDHCDAIQCVLERGRPGEVYNIGGKNEKTNLEIVHTLCDLLNQKSPRKDAKEYQSQIRFVKDRLGHDRRYAINATKIEKELNWTPKESFETGIKKTIDWYLSNQSWVKNVSDGSYQNWIQKQYS